MSLLVKFGLVLACVLATSYIFAKGQKSITVGELHGLVVAKEGFKGVLMDVRTPKETSSGVLKGAVVKNAYDQDIESYVKGLDATKQYYVYCHSGVRSFKMVKLMKKYNISGINVSGGISAWKKENYPIVSQKLK